MTGNRLSLHPGLSFPSSMMFPLTYCVARRNPAHQCRSMFTH
nr:MAG TPA: hypothetical protein [Caudoviricetes sp.]